MAMTYDAFERWITSSDGQWAYKLCVERCTNKEAIDTLRIAFNAGRDAQKTEGNKTRSE
jgi:hypothetical protein